MTTGAWIGERVECVTTPNEQGRPFTVTTGPTGADESHYERFGDALAWLARYAEQGRRARIHVHGQTLAWTREEHRIELAGGDR